ncbi:MAG: hypothetical protein H6581_19075 [Bacteroidia bacterium]|nr:hypothetical protein [Bacteroidia bacterium]
MKKILLSLLPVLLVCLTGFSQSSGNEAATIAFKITESKKSTRSPFVLEDPPKNSLRVTMALNYSRKFSNLGRNQANNFDFGLPQLSWIHTIKKKYFMETGLTMGATRRSSIQEDSLGTIVGGIRVSNFSMGLSWGFFWDLRDNLTRKIHPYIGAVSGVSFSATHVDPLVSTKFPNSYQSAVIPLSVVPGVRIFTRKSLFFDLQASITAYNLELNYYRRMNPGVPVSAQSSFTFNLDSPLWNSVQLRGGIGFIL